MRRLIGSALAIAICKQPGDHADFEPARRLATVPAGERATSSSPQGLQTSLHIDRVDHLVLTVADVDRGVAAGPITSVYFRDPDGNLVEVSNY